ncbi:restriction endonuclease subunit S [Aeromonas dhakensis]|uniref:restriction endonuclease subunit S n=1 Tax=Aeromonas dhakensis TaxID=196024 RepID=UPI003F87D16B
MSEAVATSQQGLVEQYQPYPEYKDSGVEWLGDVPTDWRVIKLGFLATKIGSGKTPFGGATVYVDDGITFLRSQNVYDDGLRLDDVVHITPDVDMEMAHSRVKPMDILINITGASIGRTCIVPLGIGSANVNQHVCIIRLNKSEIIRFVSWAVKAQSTKAQIDNAQTGAAREGLNFEQIASLLLSLPPETECEQISDFLDYETTRIDRLIAQQHRLIELLKEKRQAVISHAVTKGLNPNALMKDSGVEWLGQVPEHWIVAGFKKYIEPIVDYRGKTPTKTESGVFLVTARNIKNGSIDYILSEEFISEDDYEEVMRRGKPKLGDVLFTTEAPLGEVAQVDNESIALAQRIIKFRGLRDILDCSYLKLFIQSTEFQHGLMTFATGSTALGIKSDRLGYLKQLVPPISEQNQIVEFVAKHAMQFDKLIDIANKAIQLMLERRTALISAAVTGRIDLRGWTPPAEEIAA